MTVPDVRRRRLADDPLRADRQFVLYWMVAYRRPTYNFALQRARDLAVELESPLVVLEPLRYDYQWACDRFHDFVLDGMADNREAFDDRPVRYYPFVATPDHPGEGLIENLAVRSCAIVTDDFPAFFIPRMLDAVSCRVDVHFEAVDSNGIVPIRATAKIFKRAWDFRRHLHQLFADGQPEWPEADPLENLEVSEPPSLNGDISDRWPEATDQRLDDQRRDLTDLPLNHSIVPNPDLPGGFRAARRRLSSFVETSLTDYHERRNEVGDAAESWLSPYLHFGHIGSQRIFDAVIDDQDWNRQNLDFERVGKREDFWGMAPGAEEFVDQFVSWREVGFNRCMLDPDGYDDYETLPEWARNTLAEHRDDPRPHVYDLEQFEAGRTHDELWNAAQMQLVETGGMHNYMRMFWGKKILHWSKSPRQALEIMLELNNKYALDGRDPNSYNGIFWVLGRYDRAWGPEREIFGKIRYMTSQSTRRKFNVDDYIEQFAPNSGK